MQNKISELGLENEVKFLGIISESDLISLYKMAKLVVIPTMYEAGSGPLYEAMKYNSPVICSNVTSLPDTVNNNEFLFNPENLEEVTEMIKKGLMDNEFRGKNIDNSITRIKELSKTDYSVCFTDAYAKVLGVYSR